MKTYIYFLILVCLISLAFYIKKKQDNVTLAYFFEPKKGIRKDVKIYWVPYQGIHSINSDTLHERYGYQTSKPADVFRIITLGDSFTYGIYVDTKDNWTEKLEEALNAEISCKNNKKIQVINLGVGGYDIQYAVERYRLRGQKYNPDLVLWFLKDDDFKEIAELIIPKSREIEQVMKTSGELDNKIKKGFSYPAWDAAQDQIMRELGVSNILAKQKLFLQQIRKYFLGDLILMTFDFTQPGYKAIMKEFSQSKPKIYFFDQLSNPYDVSGATYPPTPHLTQKGHALIMNQIYTYLKTHSLIPCK